MKTGFLTISSDGDNVEAALAQVDKASAYRGISTKNTIYLRLLAEETLAMMRAITGNVNGAFRMEDEDQVYALHLQVNSLMEEKRRGQLRFASTGGKNGAARGIMGRIRSFFGSSRNGPMISAGFGSPQMYNSYVWSMGDYRDQLRQCREQSHSDADEVWDEPEKLAMGHLADDVNVSIRSCAEEMTIVKRLD